MADDKIQIVAELDLQKTSAQINKDLKSIQAMVKPLELNVNVNAQAIEKGNGAIKDLSAQLEILRNRATGSIGNLDKYFNSNTIAAQKFAPQLKTIRAELENIATATDFTSANNSYKVVTSQITAIKGQIKSLGEEGKTWFGNLSSGVTQFIKSFGGITLVYEVINAVKQGINDVVNINTAMTNLKKVTNETDATYSSFLSNASTQAKNLGASISDLVNSTADFSRLGFNLPDANELAQVATMYKNVGDVDITTATQDIVSALKAFNLQAAQSESVIDKFNEIGNNFAVSSAQLGEGLRNSASSLATAGNSIDQSLAMIAGISEITQNSSEAGNALKILSMRLRGAKTDLESMGESTDGLANSTSELREKIKALSGVDIMANDNTFKSTFEIMSEISKVYDKLSGTNQASLLETIAGKQRGNQISALIENFAQAENALNTSINSVGSAQREQDKWLDSNIAKAKQFQTTVTAIWENAISSKAIGDVTDLGTFLAQNIIPTMTTILGLMVAIKGQSIETAIGKTVSAFSGFTGDLKAFISIAEEAGGGIKGFKAALDTLNLSSVSAVGVIGILITAFSALTLGLNAFYQAQDEARQKAQQAVDNYEDEVKSIQSLIDQYDELSAKTDLTSGDKTTLKSIQDQLIKSFGLEAGSLDLVNGKYDDQIRKLQQLSLQKAKDNQDTLQANLNSAKDAVSGNTVRDYSKAYGDLSGFGQTVTDVRNLTDINILGKDAQTTYNAIEKAMDVLKQKGQQDSKTFTGLANSAAEYKEKLDDITKAQQEFNQNQLYIQFAPQMNKMAEDAQKYEDALKSGDTKVQKDAAADFQKLNDQIQNTNGLSKDLKQAFADWANGLLNVDAANKNAASSGNETSTSLATLKDRFDTLNTSYTNLQSIQDSYNQTGYLTADMLEQLVANNGELLNCIDFVNGKMVINTTALQDNASSIKTKMEEEVKATLASQIYGIMQDDLAGKFDSTGSAADTAKSAIDKITQAMGDAAVNAATLSQAYDAVLKSFQGIPGSKTEGLSAGAQKAIKDAIQNARNEVSVIDKIKLGNPSTDKAATKKAKSDAESAAKKAAQDAKEAAEKAKQAVKDAYSEELRKIEFGEDTGLYKTKLDYYNALVKLGVKYAKNSIIDQATKDQLKKQTQDALKDYEQSVLDTSLDELSYRESLGEVQSGSSQELQNLQEIYKNLTTNPLMSAVNTEKHRNEINQKIYENKKQSLENEKDELETEKSLGQIEDNSLEYINRLKKIKLDIQNSDLNAVDKAEKLRDIDEDIYSETESYRQQYNEDQINEIDHLVNIGKLEGNSLEYIQRLNKLYRTLNLTLEERESLQEKIYSSEISYIEQLEDNLTDEFIEGSYGSRMKAIQDQIDAINKEKDAISNANEATQTQIDLEKAKAALEEAQNQKTISVYEQGKGFTYQSDQKDIIEKQEAVTDAQQAIEDQKREQQIQELTEQKEKVQSEADEMKSHLEDVLKDLEGTNDKTWDDIQDEISNVIDNVNKVFKSHTSRIKGYNDELDDSLNDSTANTENDYQRQTDSMNTYLKAVQEISPKIVAQNQIVANSFSNMANAISAVGKAYLQSETDRENANWHYYEYNQELKKNGNKVKYASGTDFAQGGLSIVNDAGHEIELEPISNGNYAYLERGSKVFTAQMTDNLKKWSAIDPQSHIINTLIGNAAKTSGTSNVNTNNSISHNYHIDKVEFPNANSSVDEIMQAFLELPTYFLQKSYRNK